MTGYCSPYEASWTIRSMCVHCAGVIGAAGILNTHAPIRDRNYEVDARTHSCELETNCRNVLKQTKSTTLKRSRASFEIVSNSTVIMGKGTPAKRGKKRSEKQQRSIFADSGDDSDVPVRRAHDPRYGLSDTYAT